MDFSFLVCSEQPFTENIPFVTVVAVGVAEAESSDHKVGLWGSHSFSLKMSGLCWHRPLVFALPLVLLAVWMWCQTWSRKLVTVKTSGGTREHLELLTFGFFVLWNNKSLICLICHLCVYFMFISVALNGESSVLPPRGPLSRSQTCYGSSWIHHPYLQPPSLMSISCIDLWAICTQIMAIPLFPMLSFLGGFSSPHL